MEKTELPLLRIVVKAQDGVVLFDVSRGVDFEISLKYVKNTQLLGEQRRTITIYQIGDYIVTGMVDGKMVFSIPESDWPQDVKDQYKAERQTYISLINSNRALDDQVEEDLSVYLEKFPERNAQREIKSLPLCLRRYIEDRAVKLPFGWPECQRRMRLTVMLAKITDKIYREYVNTKRIGDIVSARERFSAWLIAGLDYHCDIDLSLIGPYVTKKDGGIESIIISDYMKGMPEINSEILKRYLNYEVRHMLVMYVHDMATLYEAPVGRLEQKYEEVKEKMELPQWQNFIL